MQSKHIRNSRCQESAGLSGPTMYNYTHVLCMQIHSCTHFYTHFELFHDLNISWFCSLSQALDSKHEKYREQVRLMLSEFRTPDPSHPSTLERREVNSSSSLPETQGTEEKGDSDTPREGGERGEEGQGEGEGMGEGEGDGEGVGGGGEGEREGDGEGEGEREGEGEGQGDRESSSTTAKTEPHASEPRTSVTREGGGPQRRVGVVDKPKVMVVGGSASSPVVNRQLSRPRSATTHAMETRAGLTKQLGRANTGVDVSLHEPASPTQRHSSLGQRKRLPVKELKIKPVQSKPSAAAQKLLQSKREKVAAEVDGGQGGGAEGEEGEGGEMQNGNATEKNQKSGIEVTHVQCTCICTLYTYMYS